MSLSPRCSYKELVRSWPTTIFRVVCRVAIDLSSEKAKELVPDSGNSRFDSDFSLHMLGAVLRCRGLDKFPESDGNPSINDDS